MKRRTHNVREPVVCRVILVSLISNVPKHVLNLILLLHRGCDLRVRHAVRVVVKLLEILHVVYIIGDLDAAARDAELVPCIPRLLLFL